MLLLDVSVGSKPWRKRTGSASEIPTFIPLPVATGFSSVIRGSITGLEAPLPVMSELVRVGCVTASDGRCGLAEPGSGPAIECRLSCAAESGARPVLRSARTEPPRLSMVSGSMTEVGREPSVLALSGEAMKERRNRFAERRVSASFSNISEVLEEDRRRRK